METSRRLTSVSSGNFTEDDCPLKDRLANHLTCSVSNSNIFNLWRSLSVPALTSRKPILDAQSKQHRRLSSASLDVSGARLYRS
jgi:hypothetical protein